MISKRYFLLSLLALVAMASVVSESRKGSRPRDEERIEFHRPDTSARFAR